MKNWKKYVITLIWMFVLMFQVQQGSAQTGTCGENDSVSYTVSGTDTEKRITFTAAGPNAKWSEDCKAHILSAEPKRVNVIMNANGKKITLSSGKELFKRSFEYIEAMDLTGFDVSGVTDMSEMFFACDSLKTLDVSGWNTARVTTMNAMFAYCESLTRLDLSSWDTSSLTNMDSMFANCYSLTTLDLSSWETSSVTNLNYMFEDCESLKTLDLSGWDTARVKYMVQMFDRCVALTTLDVSGWDTSSAEYINNMFSYCSSLTTLDLSGWDTSSVREMQSMFFGCSSLTTLDLSSWDTSQVTKMNQMFANCYSLTTLDLSSWDTSSVTNLNYMFSECSALDTVILGNAMGSEAFNSLPSNVLSEDWYYVNGYYKDSTPLNTALSGSELFGSPTDHPGTWSRTEGGYTCGRNVKPEYTELDDGSYALSFKKLDADKDAAYGIDCTYFITHPLPQNAVVTSVTIADRMGVQRAGTQGLFRQLTNIKSIDLSNLDVSGVRNMGSMFESCSALTTLEVGGWDTAQVTNMSYMFENCNSLTSLDVSGWDTAQVTNMSYMFNGCGALTSLEVGGWNTGKVEFMNSMFYGCEALTSLDLGGWNTEFVTDPYSTFSECVSVGEWTIGPDTTKVNIFADMPGILLNADWNYVNGYYGDGSIQLGAAAAGDQVFSGSPAYAGKWSVKDTYTCGINVKPEYTELDDGSYALSFKKLDADKDAAYGIDCTYFIKHPVPGDEDVTSVTIADRMGVQGRSAAGLFRELSAIKSMDLSKLDVSGVTNMGSMFFYCSKLVRLEVGGWDTSAVTDMSRMFFGCGKLGRLDVDGWDTSAVTDMSYMFNNCAALKDPDLSGWDTSSVTDMSGMFYGCEALTSLDLSGWDTGKVQRMVGMFQNCQGLTSLDVSGWNTGNVTVMSQMFWFCGALTSLDLSGWDTSRVTNMSLMFQDCSGLTSLDLGGWNTAGVTSMYSMFYYCSALTSLDLSGWDTGNVTSMKFMFAECNALRFLTLGENSVKWNIYETLPGYDKPWYYAEQGADADQPLSLMTEKTNGDLFTGYDFHKMAGTWSLYLPAETVSIKDDSGRIIPNGAIMAVARAANQFTGFAEPEEAYQEFIWTSSDPETAAVHQNGIVFFQKGGEVTITAAAVDDISKSSSVVLRYEPLAVSTCGTNVAYSLSGGNTITFSKADAASEAVWGSDCTGIYRDDPEITALNVTGAVKIDDTAAGSMFTKNHYLEAMDLRGLDVSGVTSMQAMFWNCAALEHLDLSGWNTANVTNMGSMFSGCIALQSLDLSSWDTSNLDTYDGLFENCLALRTLTLGKDSLESINFVTLPAYYDPWYYVAQGADAVQPLDLGAVKVWADLFSLYDSNKMAGTWTVSDVQAESVKIQDASGGDLSDQTVTINTDSCQLTAAAIPPEAAQHFIWTVSDENIAAVDGSGKVTFGKAGTVTVTAEAIVGRGRTASVTLSYVPPATGVTIQNVSGADVTGQTLTINTTGYQLGVVVTPAGALQNVTWTGSDDGTASVDGTGMVSFRKAGTVTFTATTTDGSGKSASVTLTFVPPATGVTIKDPNRADITGKTVTVNTASYQLKGAAEPAEAVQKFTWAGSDAGTAAVDSTGKVTFAKAGTVTITATTTDGTNKSASVTLTYVPLATGVTIKDPNGNDITGKTLTVNTSSYQLKGAAEPPAASQKLTWTSSDTGIAAVDSTGKVTFAKGGTVTITATAADGSGVSASVTLTTDIKAAKVVIKNSSGTNITGKTTKVTKKTYQLKASAEPEAYASQQVTWKSSNTKVATVSAAGKVTFKKAGTVKITATAADGSGISATATLKTAIKATKVTIRNAKGKAISHKTLKIKTKTVSVKAVAIPAKFAAQKFTWKTSDKKIATVKAGKVTFKKAGTVKITATAKDGSKKSNWVKITYKPATGKTVEPEVVETPLTVGENGGTWPELYPVEEPAPVEISAPGFENK